MTTHPKISSKKDFKKYKIADFHNPFRVLHLSSGVSNGQSSLWARGDEQLKIGKCLQGSILKTFAIPKKDKTLIIICYKFTGWVAGNDTLLAYHELAQKENYNITIYPPGPGKEKILPYLEQLYTYYDHIIFAGIPSFILKLIKKIPQAKRRPKIYTITSGEKTTLSWKKHVIEAIGNKQPLHHHVNLYGCADAGAVAHETELSLQILLLSHQHDYMRQHLLNSSNYDRPYTIMQFDPRLIQLTTTEDNDVLITAKKNAMPLVNYHIGDKGHIISSKAMKNYLLKNKLITPALTKLFRKNTKPFLIFLGREIISLSYNYICRVYADYIADVIHQANEAKDIFTGNYIYYTKAKPNEDDTLVIELEIKNNRTKLTTNLVKQLITIMRNSNEDINEAFNTKSIKVKFNLIKHGQINKRKMQIQKLKIDAICQESDAKAKFVLLV